METSGIPYLSSILDRYQVQEVLGQGGHGLVLKAQQLSTGRTVAIKTVRSMALAGSKFVENQIARFDRETRMVAEIHHPHIVQLLDKGSLDHGQPYAVYEYVEGITLRHYLLREGKLAPERVGWLMGQVLDALVCAHELGIVHRDLKPQNIMVTQTGINPHIKVLDFGIGAFLEEDPETPRLTPEQTSFGTPGYTAPEQLRGEAPSPSSDLYSWGLIVLECLTGQPVMNRGSVAQIHQRQLDRRPVAIPKAIKAHPLGILLQETLKKEVGQRVSSTRELAVGFNALRWQDMPPEVVWESSKEGNTQDTLFNTFGVGCTQHTFLGRLRGGKARKLWDILETLPQFFGIL